MAFASHHDHFITVCCIAVLALSVAPAVSGRFHRLLVTEVVDQFLGPQNEARDAVGVAPLRWSLALADAAVNMTSQQQQHDGCGFVDVGTSPYGVNQGWASYPVSPADTVASWVAQGEHYNHADNSCAKDQDCDAYTQVVWRKTVELGCAQATCDDRDGATITICLYNPHGNVQGQKPY